MQSPPGLWTADVPARPKITLVLAVLVAIALGIAVACLQASHVPPPVVVAQPAVARPQADSGAALFAKQHLQLLDQADQLRVPTAIEPALTNVPPSHGEVVEQPVVVPQLAPAPSDRQLTIGLTSGDVGEVVDCGCTHNPQGGLARRALWWRDRKRGHPHSLLLDAGGLLVRNAGQPTERPGEVATRAELFAKAYAQMGYAALNVGAHELTYGVAGLQAFGKLGKLTVLSTNIVHAKTQAPVFATSWVRQLGPLKVGVLGLTTPQPANPGQLIDDQGLQVLDPVASAKQAVPLLRQQGVELVIVLTQLRRTEMEAVVNQVPGIDLVLGSTDMELTDQPITLGTQTLFVDGYTRGKYVADLTIHVRGQRDRFYAADLRSAKTTERSDAARQVQEVTSQLESADRPDSPLRLTAETKRIMQAQLAAARARQQRLTMELEGGALTIPPDASTIDVLAVPLPTTLGEDAAIAKLVAAFLAKYPKLTGQ